MKIRQSSNITEAVVFGLKMNKQILKKINNEAEKNGSIVKSVGCSFRVQFGSQIHLSNSKLTAILAPGVLIALFWYYLALNCVQAHKYT